MAHKVLKVQYLSNIKRKQHFEKYVITWNYECMEMQAAVFDVDFMANSCIMILVVSRTVKGYGNWSGCYAG